MSTQTELTDAEILQSLLLKKDRLIGQLSRVDIAIDAFKEDSKEDEKPRDVIRKPDSIDLSDLDEEESVIPKEYSPELSYPKKIYFVINSSNGGAFVEDVVRYIRKVEPGSDYELLKNRITQTASKLFRANKLAADKTGRRYKYKLPKK